MRTNESGNVLFYILIAIALLAALSYAVSNSSRDNASGLSQDRAKLYATDIIAYANALSNGVDQLRLRGCKFLEISFDTPNLPLHTNAAAPTDGSCDIFSPSGAGINYQPPPSDVGTNSQWSFTYENNVIGLGDNCNNISCKEMLAVISNINFPICEAINDLLDNDNPPVVEGSNVDVHINNQQYETLVVGSVELTPAMAGATKGCIQLTNLNNTAVTDRYLFYTVLWAQN